MRRVAALIALAFLLSGCRLIGFVGDSITSTSATQLVNTARATQKYDGVVYAAAGARIAEIDVLLQQALAEHPDAYAAVVNAGTNDVVQHTPTWSVDYTLLLSHASTPCVVVTTLSTLLDLDNAGTTPRAQDINAYLNVAVTTHANYRLVDWNAEIASGAPVLLPDGLHPNDTGKQWLADQDVAAVTSCVNAGIK